MPLVPGKPNLKMDAARKRAFCVKYAELGVLRQAAKAVKVDPTTIERQRKSDPSFDEAVKAAYADYCETLEREAHTRAVEGWMEPVFQGGRCVGEVLKKSDRILELVLKRHIPGYRDKQQVDMNVTGGVLVIPPTPKTSEEWEAQQGKGS